MSHKTSRSITLAGWFSKGPRGLTVTLNGISTYLGQFHREKSEAKPLFIEFQFLVRSVLNSQTTFAERITQFHRSDDLFLWLSNTPFIFTQHVYTLGTRTPNLILLLTITLYMCSYQSTWLIYSSIIIFFNCRFFCYKTRIIE